MGNLCYKLLKEEEGVKDVLQEVYVNLYTRRQVLPYDLNVEGYLTNAIKFQTANIIRHKLVKENFYRHAENQAETEVEELPIAAEYNDLNKRFNKSLAALPEKCRTAFVLHKLENNPYKIVSEKMGISVKTVEKHISKALKQLRTELSDARSIFPFF